MKRNKTDGILHLPPEAWEGRWWLSSDQCEWWYQHESPFFDGANFFKDGTKP